MADSHLTRPSLLVRMRDLQDHRAWAEFVELYSPLVYGFARKRGLQDADAVDVTQDVLRVVSRSIGRFEYATDRGSFRGWLFAIVRNELADWFSKQRSAFVGVGAGEGTQPFDEIAIMDDEQSSLWEQEHRQRIFEWATERLRNEVSDTTWNAFWKSTVEKQSGKELATELGLSVAAVYLAKSRCMTRLKELIRVSEQ